MPERTCIVSRQQRPEAELIRFVASPAGEVVPDLKRKLPGRGAWVEKRRASVLEALKRGAFAKALDGAKAGADLADLVDKLLRQELVQALSLARKAGLAVAGNTKVEEAIRKGGLAALIHVKGAAQDGMAKLNRLVASNVAILELFDAGELDLAFGRENVVHAALIAGGQARKVLDLALGLARYEGLEVKGLN